MISTHAPQSLTYSQRKDEVNELGESKWARCPRYYPLNVDVSRENRIRLRQEYPPDSIFVANAWYSKYVQQRGRKGMTNECSLSKVHEWLRRDNNESKAAEPLSLAVGAPVLITANISIQYGIINGTIGKKSDISLLY